MGNLKPFNKDQAKPQFFYAVVLHFNDDIKRPTLHKIKKELAEQYKDSIKRAHIRNVVLPKKSAEDKAKANFPYLKAYTRREQLRKYRGKLTPATIARIKTLTEGDRLRVYNYENRMAHIVSDNKEIPFFVIKTEIADHLIDVELVELVWKTTMYEEYKFKKKLLKNPKKYFIWRNPSEKRKASTRKRIEEGTFVPYFKKNKDV